MNQNGQKQCCIICNKNDLKKSIYPPTLFNDRYFYYYECLHCKSLSVFPLPGKEDFKLIYGSRDHSYLNELGKNETVKYPERYPRFNYQNFQLKFLKEAANLLKDKRTLLDFGCGNGFYMRKAQDMGLDTVGVEFSADFAIIMANKTGLKIISEKKLEEEFAGQAFDVIHLGHVLEHLPNPYFTFLNICNYASVDTVFLIDGPLENNPCLSRWLISLGSKLKGRKCNELPPQHIIFTTAKSQLMMFEIMGLQRIKFKVVEQLWPLPEKFDLTSPASWVLYPAALYSVGLSSLVANWGNVFHFAGSLNPSITEK